MLQPGLLRIGGSAQRGFPVCPGFNDTRRHPEAWNATCLTQPYFKSLCAFAHDIGAGLVYGLNTGRMEDNIALLDDVRVNGTCPSLYAITLGNEGVPGSPAEFIRLRAALDEFDKPSLPAAATAPAGAGVVKEVGREAVAAAATLLAATGAERRQSKRPLLVGPDSAMTPWGTCPSKNNCPGYFVPLATKIIRECGQVLDAASFHVYVRGCGYDCLPPCLCMFSRCLLTAVCACVRFRCDL